MDLTQKSNQKNKQILLFFCSRLGGGGAEMHLRRILNKADFEEYDIHLALTRNNGNYENELDARIIVHYLNQNIRSSTLALILSILPLKNLIRFLNPKVVVSFMDNQNIVLSLIHRIYKKMPPIVLCCQNAPSKSLSHNGILGQINKLLLPKLYPEAKKIIAICKGVKNNLAHSFKLNVPIEVIYNAGFDETIYEKMETSLPDRIKRHPLQFVACGRLTAQKGFDILLESIASLTLKEDFHLWILGKGQDENNLKNQAKKLGINNRVSFLGFQENPFMFFRNADLFILSSRWEGFGNVIIEAMACGIPVLATKCQFGPEEIITNNSNGLLVSVEDKEALKKGIESIVSNNDKRIRFARQGENRALDFTAKKNK